MTPPERPLPTRDFILLPLLSLITVVTMLGLAEVASRALWPAEERDACEYHDPRLGSLYRPNCVSRIKSPESPWVVNAYNACGYRTPEACGPKPAGGLRVALLGASVGRGHLVPYGDTFASRATVTLRGLCRRPVEFQNLGGRGTEGVDTLPVRAAEALRLDPDAIVLTVAPFDLQQLDTGGAAAETPAPGARPNLVGRLYAFSQQLRVSRAYVMAQHVLYKDLDVYLPLYLKHGDDVDFLRPPFTAAWRRRFDRYERALAGVAEVAEARRLPVILVFVPLRAQAALVRWNGVPKGVDPHALGQELGRISARHGVRFVDLTDQIGRRPDAAELFYPVDTHPNAEGHAEIGRGLMAALLTDVPAFKACAAPR